MDAGSADDQGTPGLLNLHVVRIVHSTSVRIPQRAPGGTAPCRCRKHRPRNLRHRLLSRSPGGEEGIPASSGYIGWEEDTELNRSCSS